MKYHKAAERLPTQLLQELQKYAAGELLYIPAAQRKAWGEGTGAKAMYARRNAEIRKAHKLGTAMDTLSESYFLSDDALRKILYPSGGNTMNEINYDQYYWQNELVRVRRSRPEDWKLHKFDMYDSPWRFFTDYEQELPMDEKLRQEGWEKYINENWDSETRICLAFETPEGEYIGGGNLHGIDQRNGTFGLFFGSTEENCALAGARLMLDYAFNELRLHRCHTGFIAEDAVNIKLFEQLGFTKEGTRREQVFHQGRFWDEVLYGLLASEFNAAK
ncbi:MAG: GNAT family N-acetyltransferase [Oscillospiraceae bacterium]|nr:GNAT family N-acetyltransferase [Oscillospiraceae bacterium]